MTNVRKDTIQKRKRIILSTLILMLSMCIKPYVILGEEKNIVKVGYANVPGFTEIKDGVYTGYAYEYLVEMAKYTGWEYEFVEMSLNELIYQLRDGKIDLAAGMLQNEQTEQMYDFPKENAGYTYTTLSTLKENNSISSSNYETFRGMRVGYYQTSTKRLEHFLNFCQENDIEDIQFVEYIQGEGKGLIEALKDKEVDAIIDGDLLVGEEQKVIAKFEAVPYYFATTKGNKKILEGLNKALSKIEEDNPHFNENTYNKYFKDYADHSVYLTRKEQEYIQQMEPLKVAYVDHFAPLQNYNTKTMQAEGIYVDIMALIAKKSGLCYHLVKADNYQEAYEMIKAKEVDLILAVSDNYLNASEYEYSLTQGYFDINMVKVFDSKKFVQEGEKILALPYGYVLNGLGDGYEIQYYETIKDCLDAVKKGEAAVTYGNAYIISKYIASGYCANLSAIFEEIPVQAIIGIAKPTNLTLLEIINKSVASLSESEIREIIYDNALSAKKTVTLKQFFYDNLGFCIYAITALILLFLVAKIRYKHYKKEKLLLLRKSQIDPLTGVYNRATGVESVTTYLTNKESSLYGALIIIDIDYFKQVNDYLGHQAGDELLVDFSQLLKSVFTPQDIIFRLGGDEFVVMMTHLKPNTLQRIRIKLHELHQSMNKEISYEGHTQKVSLSIGAVVTSQITDFDQLYQEADKVLYEVKRNGRNGFKIKEIK